MRVEVLSVPGCPNSAVLATRLDEVLSGRPDVDVTYRIVENQRQAEITGMTGSPTVLVNGVDPFAQPGGTPSVSCRLYQDEHGRVTGAPSTPQLRRVLGV